MKAPLNMMSAGDLGLSSSEVESALSNVLEMCTKWNAILLLDEADGEFCVLFPLFVH